MIEKANKHSIEELFNKHFYLIPEYQREYSWKVGQWDHLFNDLNESDKEYFLGTLICIIEGDNTFKVVDGQQRLTTLSIFRLVIFEMLQKSKLAFMEDDDLQEMYLNLKSSIIKKTKNRLTLQGSNKKEYEDLVEHVLNKKEDSLDKRKRVFKAYYFFIDKLSDFKTKELFSLLNKINTALIVRIEVNSDQDAFILFESINNTGMPLSAIDLIKSKLFSSLNGDIAEHNTKWQEIIDNLENFKFQVRFIRQFYNVFKDRGVEGINKVFPSVPKVSKATSTNIITVFDYWINEKTSTDIFEALIKTSEIYKKLILPSEIKDTDIYYDKELIDKLEDLIHLGISPSYSLLMYLIDRKIDKDELKNILNLLEIWSIRRHLTNKPTTGKLDQVFMDIVNQIEKVKNEDNLNYEEIIKNKLFKDYNSLEDVKNKLKGNIYDENTSLTLYLLITLEKYLQGSVTRENSKTNFWETFDGKRKKKTPIWSIEHILPQTLNKKNNEKEFWDKDSHQEYIHKIGNLTLTGYNGRLSNKSFKDKKVLVNDEGDAVGYDSNKIKLNDSVKKYDKWEIKEIEERSEILINDLVKILAVDGK